MKNQILTALKTKFPGVSEHILNRMAEKLAKTVTKEEDVAAAVEAVTFQQVIDSESDRRATEASQTAVTNYEKKHSLQEGKPVNGGEAQTETEASKSQNQGGDITAIITNAVNAAMKPLQTEIETLKTGKIIDARQQQLNVIIEKLPENLKKPYTRIPVKDMTDEEFAAFVTETEAGVEAVLTDYNTKGAVVKPPIGGSVQTKKEPTKEEADAILKGII